MSNETKRDVFDAAMSLIRSFEETFLDHSSYHGSYTKTKCLCERYSDALPDDLPVIPKEVSDRLKQAKADRSSLRYMFAASSINMLSDWWMAQDPENEDTFARAWVIGVWRVEETGEIVKVEAEK